MFVSEALNRKLLLWARNLGTPSIPDESRKPNINILLALTAVALLCKLAILLLSIRTSMSFSLPSSENWQDFSLAYVPAVNAFKNGFLPYGDFYYPYPPLFLYILTLFSYLPLPSWSSALPLVIADALTVIPVYLIAREFIGERYSLVASIVFVLAPINLFYVDYLWLNPSLTTLFLMSSIYFLIKGHYDLSAVTLALSIGFKQTALLVLPIVVFILWRKLPRRRAALRYLFLTASICFLISIPFIFISPVLYLDLMFRVPNSLWSVSYLPPGYFTIGFGTGTPITANTLSWITSKWQTIVGAVNNPVSLGLPIFIFLLPTAFSWIYDSVYYPGLLWVISSSRLRALAV